MSFFEGDDDEAEWRSLDNTLSGGEVVVVVILVDDWKTPSSLVVVGDFTAATVEEEEEEEVTGDFSPNRLTISLTETDSELELFNRSSTIDSSFSELEVGRES